MTSWRDLPGPARAIGSAISAAVAAAGDTDAGGYAAATAALSTMPTEPVGIVLGAIVRELLEDQHPDGLDSDDIQTVLGRCYRGATGWLPASAVEVHPLVAVLASALGIHEPGVTFQEIAGPPPRRGDDWAGDPDVAAIGADPAAAEPVAVRVPSTAAYAWHAPLLIADLLAAGGRSVDRYLDAAFAEIARAETMEMP